MREVLGGDLEVSVARLSPISEMVVLGHVLDDPSHHTVVAGRRANGCFSHFCAGLLFLNVTESLASGSIDEQLAELARMDGQAFLLRLLRLRDDQAGLLFGGQLQRSVELTVPEWERLVDSPELVKQELSEALTYCASVHRRLARPGSAGLTLECSELRSTLAKTGLADALLPLGLRVAVSQYLFPHVAMVHTRDGIVIVLGEERFAKGDLAAVVVHELTHVAFEWIQIPRKVVDYVERECQAAKQRYGALYSAYDYAEELLVDVLCRFYSDQFSFSPESVNDLELGWQREILQRMPRSESRVAALTEKMLEIAAEITI